MDLSKLGFTEAAETGADLILEHPITGEKYDITITLLSTGSSKYRAKQKELQNRRMRQVSRGKHKDFVPTDEENCELLATCTLGWSGLAYESEEEMEFCFKNAKYVYSKEYWIYSQVNEFMADETNFFSDV
jgi:hypothetical protein